MIVYDIEAYVEKAIKSVLAQTYKDFEFILVVGRGEDKCLEICEKYAQLDSRIKLKIITPNGAADARNHGMELVTGDYLGFVDGDDYIEPDMYESMMNNIKKYDADIAVCGRFYEYQNTTLQDVSSEPIVLSADEALKVTLSHEGFFLHCWDKLYSRKIYEGLNFETKLIVEDRIIVDEMLGKADRIVYDSTPKYHFRERSGSISKQRVMVRNNIKADEVMLDFIKREHPAILPDGLTFILYEYITAIQNELTDIDTNYDDIREYQKCIRKLMKDDNLIIGKGLRVKAYLALYAKGLLGIYTKLRKKNVSQELVRFQ